MVADSKVVLVAGVHGLIGQAVAEHFVRQRETKVYGLPRRADIMTASTPRKCCAISSLR